MRRVTSLYPKPVNEEGHQPVSKASIQMEQGAKCGARGRGVVQGMCEGEGNDVCVLDLECIPWCETHATPLFAGGLPPALNACCLSAKKGQHSCSGLDRRQLGTAGDSCLCTHFLLMRPVPCGSCARGAAEPCMVSVPTVGPNYARLRVYDLAGSPELAA
eukprot:360329-Chlamydomonas_euryale.AAC.5